MVYVAGKARLPPELSDRAKKAMGQENPVWETIVTKIFGDRVGLPHKLRCCSRTFNLAPFAQYTPENPKGIVSLGIAENVSCAELAVLLDNEDSLMRNISR